MTATTPAPMIELLKLKDEEFEATIKDMGQRNLMDLITGLQKEMSREQENFNSMSEELKGFKDRNSRQYKQISKELVSSQTRLTMLMNKSMKCFAQQNFVQGKDGVVLRRKNSLKGNSDSSQTKIVQRSQSMYIPQDHDITALRTGSNQNINRISVNNSMLHAKSPQTQTWSNNSSNIIRIQNSKNPKTSFQNFSSNSNFTSQNLLTSQASQSMIDLSQNSPQSTTGKKTVSVNLHPENMKTSISIGSSKPIKSMVASPDVFSKNEPIQSNVSNNDDENRKSLPSVRQLAQSFGNANQPSAPPRPNRANVLMNRNLSMSTQNLSTPQKVNGVQSSLQNGDLESQQRKVVSQPINIKGKQTAANSRPVSVVGVRETTPVEQTSPLVQKSHSIQNLNISNDSTVKTTLNVSFGNSQKSTNSVTVNNSIVNKNTDIKNNENRHSWSGQKGNSGTSTVESLDQKGNVETGTLSMSQLKANFENNSVTTSQRKDNSENTVKKEKQETVKPKEVQKSTSTKVTISQSTTDTKKVVQSSPEAALSQNNDGASEPRENNSQKLNITSVSSSVVNQSEDNEKKHRPINLKKTAEEIQADNEDDLLVVTPRMNLIDWDPVKLLKKLYHVKLIEETAEDISYKYVSMEGYMEKLPMNKKKATLLKTWKRRYFQAKDGWLHYYEGSNRDKPSDSVQLMGGKILEMTELGSRILGVDDGRGRFLMVRVPTDKEYGQWVLALESQTLDNTKACYVQPTLSFTPHPQKKVLVIDMGSSAIRAGLLGEHPTLPQMFFPSIASVNKKTGDIVVGIDAYKPENRSSGSLIHPVHPSNKIDKFTIDWKAMKIIFQKIIQELKINSSQYWVMLSTPQSLGDNLKEGLMSILIDELHVCGVCMVQQALLSLYSYKATSGVIVDIGQRIEILPIFDGFVIEGGVSRLPYGSEKILDTLVTSLLENNYSFSSTVEQLIVKYIMEQSCYVSGNYKNELAACLNKDNKISTTVKLTDLDLPPTAYKEVKFDEGRFKSPEGLFDTDMWEMDYPNLHKLVFQAIQACPMDSRRHMYRAIYLSGGVTMLPGFVDRFELELTKLAPPGVPIDIHASQNRYHAAYIGACSVAGMGEFEMMCISKQEWKRDGRKCFRKWKAPTL